MLIYVASSLVSTLYSKTHGLEGAENGVLTMSIFTYQVTCLRSFFMFQSNQSVTHPYASSVLQNGPVFMSLARLDIMLSKECFKLVGTVPSYFAKLSNKKSLDTICSCHDMT